MTIVIAMLLGIVAGLRVMTVPAAVSWAARAGALDFSASRFAFLGNAWVPWLLTGLALAELVTDQLPKTPSRTVPVQFGARVVVGALAGAVISAHDATGAAGAVAGAVGAALGTLGGHAARTRLAEAFGRDRPAAFLEDAVAVGTAALLMVALS